MACKWAKGWTVVDPRRNKGGGWLHLMNDSSGTEVVENVRFNDS